MKKKFPKVSICLLSISLFSSMGFAQNSDQRIQSADQKILIKGALKSSGTELISADDFFKTPQYGSPILSPDGKNLAVLTPRNGKQVLAVIDLETRKPRVVASDPEWNIASPRWVGNNRLIFSLSRGTTVTAADEDGGGLFAINIDGSQFRTLNITIKDARNGVKGYKPLGIVAVDHQQSHLIVQDGNRGRDATLGATDLFRLDTITGKRQLLTFENPGKVSSWSVDHQFTPRAALSYSIEEGSKRLKQTLYYREHEKQAWRSIYTGYADQGNTISDVEFDFDNKTMIVAMRPTGVDKSGLYIWDFEKNAPGELLADHPEADIEALDINRHQKKIIGTTATGLESEDIFFDEDYAKIKATLQASFPNKQVYFSWAAGNVLVRVFDKSHPVSVYLYDVKSKKIEFIFDTHPQLKDKQLATQEPIYYTARDGLKIPAYLTLPPGTTAKKLPLVAYVHGGPHSRDNQGYDPLVQLMANRGYAVLQPQFRMSIGFGWKLHRAGWKQWGLGMQDDVTDGVRYLIDQGIVDKDRVCIMGASYGGYATMYGLIKDPDFYRCGINFVGVTDVKMLFTVTWSDMQGPVMDDIGAKMHGDPKTDEAYFVKSSAILNASKIKAPVLMAYGADDVRVPLIHGEKMRDALKANGTPVDWMVFTGEGHGWRKESNNVLWGNTVIDFLNKHLSTSK